MSPSAPPHDIEASSLPVSKLPADPSSSSPISLLPPEVLLVILEFACLDEGELDLYRPRARLFLSSVCSQWRNIMLSASIMWDTIRLETPLHEFMMHEFARRAGDRLLTLLVVKHARDLMLAPAIHIPQHISKRISCLRLTDGSHRSWLRFEPTEHAGLVELRLGPLSSAPPSNYADGLPHSLAERVAAEDLRSLFIMEFLFDRTSLAESHYLLVERLTCRNAVVRATRQNRTTPYLFPRLRSLELQDMGGWDALENMGIIRSPALTHLKLSNLHSPVTDDWDSDNIRHTVCQLTHVAVVGDGDSLDVAGKLFSQSRLKAPALRTLELQISLGADSPLAGNQSDSFSKLVRGLPRLPATYRLILLLYCRCRLRSPKMHTVWSSNPTT